MITSWPTTQATLGVHKTGARPFALREKKVDRGGEADLDSDDAANRLGDHVGRADRQGQERVRERERHRRR